MASIQMSSDLVTALQARDVYLMLFNAGPPSAMLAQHQINNGSTFAGCSLKKAPLLQQLNI